MAVYISSDIFKCLTCVFLVIFAIGYTDLGIGDHLLPQVDGVIISTQLFLSSLAVLSVLELVNTEYPAGHIGSPY